MNFNEGNGIPLEKSPQNPYDLQLFEGHADFATILIKQRDMQYISVKIS